MASYNGNGAFVLPRALRIKNGVNVETIAVARTLTLKDSMVQLLDNSSGGSLELHFPPYKEGAIFAVKSTGTHSIVCKRESGSVIDTIAAGEGALLVCTGSAPSSDWVVVIKA
tara:strand:- start:2119 stop:2457 length:339 start_codon:yes stop_codon:yes gene_type:complete